MTAAQATPNYKTEGEFLAAHEMHHLHLALDKAMTNIAGHDNIHSRTQLYALRHLIALDNHIKRTIANIHDKEPA